jgi:hypothetical protein
MNPPTLLLPPDHPLANLPPYTGSVPMMPPSGHQPEERGRAFMSPPPSALGQAPTPAPAPAAEPVDHAAALQQLATLETFAVAVDQARALGGPTAALQQLIAQPVRIGGTVLQPISMFTFLFLQSIGSPFITAGPVNMEDIGKALIAFTAPEQASTYLTFTDSGVIVDRARLLKETWQLAARLDTKALTAATHWITGQIGGLAALFPTGEEAGNFPKEETATPGPPESLPPVPPAGSSSSSIS